MKDINGTEYYDAYILIYLDNILIIDNNPELPAHETKVIKHYNVPEETICEPNQYLGADVRKVHFTYAGIHTWTISLNLYIKNTIKNIKVGLRDDGVKLNS